MKDYGNLYSGLKYRATICCFEKYNQSKTEAGTATQLTFSPLYLHKLVQEQQSKGNQLSKQTYGQLYPVANLPLGLMAERIHFMTP